MNLEFCSVQTIISSSHFFSSALAPLTEEDVRGLFFGSQDYECSFLTNVASLHLLYGLYEVSDISCCQECYFLPHFWRSVYLIWFYAVLFLTIFVGEKNPQQMGGSAVCENKIKILVPCIIVVTLEWHCNCTQWHFFPMTHYISNRIFWRQFSCLWTSATQC